MRAVVFEAPDGKPDSTVIKDMPTPAAAQGQVLVQVAYAGLNYADLMMRSGIYPHPKGYPLIAGLELAGTVAEVGAGVTGITPGDRVAAFSEDRRSLRGILRGPCREDRPHTRRHGFGCRGCILCTGADGLEPLARRQRNQTRRCGF